MLNSIFSYILLYYLYVTALWCITIITADFYYPRLIILPKRRCCSEDASRAHSILVSKTSLLKDLTWKAQTKLQPDHEPSTLNKLLPPGLQPSTTNDKSSNDMEKKNPQMCSELPCFSQLKEGPVCACNFNTGNVVSFKNKCDLKKHNCRFDTGKIGEIQNKTKQLNVFWISIQLDFIVTEHDIIQVPSHFIPNYKFLLILDLYVYLNSFVWNVLGFQLRRKFIFCTFIYLFHFYFYFSVQGNIARYLPVGILK